MGKFKEADRLAAQYAYELPQTLEERLHDMADDILAKALDSESWRKSAPTPTIYLKSNI